MVDIVVVVASGVVDWQLEESRVEVVATGIYTVLFVVMG
jgi:hypothetical protein